MAMSKADKRFWRMFWLGLFVLASLAVGVCFDWEVPNPWTFATLTYMAGIVIGGESETLRAAASVAAAVPVPPWSGKQTSRVDDRDSQWKCGGCGQHADALVSGPSTSGQLRCPACWKNAEAKRPPVRCCNCGELITGLFLLGGNGDAYCNAHCKMQGGGCTS